MSEAPVGLRVGDRERRVVDARLQAAVGDGVLTLAEYDDRAALLWRARTRGELDALVADLPAEERPASGPVAPAQRVPVVPEPARPGAPTRLLRRLGASLVPLVLLGGAGAVVASGQDARAVFGSATEVVPPGGDGQVVEVSVLFGSVQVVVPDGARVDTSGLVVFGSVDCGASCAGTGDGRRVQVRARGGFGSVQVVTQAELDRQREADRLEKVQDELDG